MTTRPRLRPLLFAVVLFLANQAATFGVRAQIEAPVLNVDDTGIEWTAGAGATGYDLIRGDLSVLRQSGGDFRAATQVCMQGQWEPYPETRLPYTGVPTPGEGFWFLVRGVTQTEVGAYDSGGPGQVGMRDQEIDSSVRACTSPVAPRAPIQITGDAGFTSDNGVVGGSGTPADPYLISGWRIDCPTMDSPAGIEVSNTLASFVIRNVVVLYCQDGILMSAASNGRVERSSLESNVNGVRMVSGGDVAIEGSRLIQCTGIGIGVFGATNVRAVENEIWANHVGLQLDGASSCAVHHNNFMSNDTQAIDQSGGPNSWDASYPEGGNYWSDYPGTDACSGPAQDDCSQPDGYGDSWYTPDPGASDRYPRMRGFDPWGDTYPPTVSILAPTDGTVVSTNLVSVSGSASDSGSGVIRVEARVNGGPWTIVATGPGPWGSWFEIASGTNLIEARSFDLEGYTSATATRTVTLYDDPSWDAVVQTDMASYVPGAAVAISFLVTNVTAAPITLHFTSTCQAGFDVRDEQNTVVYDQGLHVPCFAVLTQRTWQPGETVTYNFTWNQVDDAGQQVPTPAGYAIRGFLVSREEIPEGLAIIDITSASE